METEQKFSLDSPFKGGNGDGVQVTYLWRSSKHGSENLLTGKMSKKISLDSPFKGGNVKGVQVTPLQSMS
jgi:hypothetical protein